MTTFTPCNSTVDQISMAVLQQLLPYINRSEENLRSLNDKVRRISDDLEALDQNLQQDFSIQLKYSYGYVFPPHSFSCGGTGGWRRVVYLNMTDPNTGCPLGWQLTDFSKRTCGRVSNSSTCDSVTFPVQGSYTKVCGRIIAYQDGHTNAFEANRHRTRVINQAYVAGVSLTHGRPRQHIWTFAAGASEFHRDQKTVCPCDATTFIRVPPFVGGDYFCESGRQSGLPRTADPLWDGDGCSSTSTCCSFNNPPYFTKQLPSPTTDDIEARLCFPNAINGDVPIEFIELYVQ